LGPFNYNQYKVNICLFCCWESNYFVGKINNSIGWDHLTITNIRSVSPQSYIVCTICLVADPLAVKDASHCYFREIFFNATKTSQQAKKYRIKRHIYINEHYMFKNQILKKKSVNIDCGKTID